MSVVLSGALGVENLAEKYGNQIRFVFRHFHCATCTPTPSWPLAFSLRAHGGRSDGGPSAGVARYRKLLRQRASRIGWRHDAPTGKRGAARAAPRWRARELSGSFVLPYVRRRRRRARAPAIAHRSCERRAAPSGMDRRCRRGRDGGDAMSLRGPNRPRAPRGCTAIVGSRDHDSAGRWRERRPR